MLKICMKILLDISTTKCKLEYMKRFIGNYLLIKPVGVIDSRQLIIKAVSCIVVDVIDLLSKKCTKREFGFFFIKIKILQIFFKN